MHQKIPFVDLFCGAGGLSVGFEMAGFRSVFGSDNDQFCCETYKLNHPRSQVVCDNVENLTGRQILQLTGLSKVPLVVGGPNCQGVSLRGKRNPADPKNQAFFHFQRLIGELNPTWFIMENVPGLLHRHNRGLLRDILASFQSLGYRCGGEVLLAADYGVPQLRYRFLLLGTKGETDPVFPNPTHRCPIDFRGNAKVVDNRPEQGQSWLSVESAIRDLPPIANGGGLDVQPYPDMKKISKYQRLLRRGSKKVNNHVCHKTPDHNIRLIKHIPAGRNWKSIPTEIRPERFNFVAEKDHTTTFGRLSWDMPSRTITTYFNNISSGAFTHPEQDRGISVREGARLQSFPDKFQFLGPLSRQYRQVGNAVPPLMAREVAGVIPCRSHP